MSIYPGSPALRHALQKHSSRFSLLFFDALQLLYPITLVISPCLAVFTFVSSVMGSLVEEPMWLGLMHIAVVAEMPLIITCTIENRFIQQQKPPASIARISRARQGLFYLITVLWCLATSVALLAHPSCDQDSPWRLSLTPKFIPPEMGSVEEATLANCRESLVALGMSFGNALLCLFPVACTLVVQYALTAIDGQYIPIEQTAPLADPEMASSDCEA